LSRLSSFGIKFNATETLLATKIAAATFRYTGKCLAQVAVINEVSESIASEFLASLGTRIAISGASLFQLYRHEKYSPGETGPKAAGSFWTICWPGCKV
jgi:hypothetical protein